MPDLDILWSAASRTATTVKLLDASPGKRHTTTKKQPLNFKGFHVISSLFLDHLKFRKQKPVFLFFWGLSILWTHPHGCMHHRFIELGVVIWWEPPVCRYHHFRRIIKPLSSEVISSWYLMFWTFSIFDVPKFMFEHVVANMALFLRFLLRERCQFTVELLNANQILRCFHKNPTVGSLKPWMYQCIVTNRPHKMRQGNHQFWRYPACPNPQGVGSSKESLHSHGPVPKVTTRKWYF